MTAKSDDDTTKQAFLDALALTGVKKAACQASGVHANKVNHWLASDPQFAVAFDEAMDESADDLETEARRRAVEGVRQTKYAKDGTTYEEVKYSDTLLIFLLNGAKPEKYKHRTTAELTGPGGAPLNDMSETTMAARMSALLDSARHRMAESLRTVATDIDPLS